jgi:hypothetical protein
MSFVVSTTFVKFDTETGRIYGVGHFTYRVSIACLGTFIPDLNIEVARLRDNWTIAPVFERNSWKISKFQNSRCKADLLPYGCPLDKGTPVME